MKHETKQDAYDRVTNHVLALLEQGTLPWEPAYIASHGLPKNYSTGHAYSGINVFLLGAAASSSPWFMTFRQAMDLGGMVRKGEKGHLIVKYGTWKRHATSESEEASTSKPHGYLRTYTVFNASQIDGIDFPTPQRHPGYSPTTLRPAADRLVAEMPRPPPIREGSSTIPAYLPQEDRIEMPARECFLSEEAYYKTLFHELTHATGHAERLARPSLMDSEGILAASDEARKTYCLEELVAEMGSAYLSSHLGIMAEENDWDSASYIQGWLGALKIKDHRRWLIQAASQAQKASDYILARSES